MNSKSRDIYDVLFVFWSSCPIDIYNLCQIVIYLVFFWDHS